MKRPILLGPEPRAAAGAAPRLRAATVSALLPLLVLALLPAAAPAQYSDYDWAMALHKEFGFDDMAEKILTGLTTNPRSSATEKQQGRLGLAALRGGQAKEANELDRQLALYAEARDLMDEVIESWPSKSGRDYWEALFSLVDLLKERAELALEASQDETRSEEKRQTYSDEAANDFTKADLILLRIMDSAKDVTLEDSPTAWYRRGRAWYNRCLITYQKALTYKDGSVQQLEALTQAAELLEEFILEMERDDDRAMLAALYGYLLQGQIQAALDHREDALANFRSVIDNPLIPYDRKLTPQVQGLVERAYYLLLEQLNEYKRYEDTLRFGNDMIALWKKHDMTFAALGRGARVELAEAQFRLGNTSEALAAAAEVAQMGRRDPSGVLANRLIAEIISSTPDKTQFSPTVIQSAARGAWSRGSDYHEEAVTYYRILIQVLGQIEDEKLRKEAGAEAWYRLAYRAYEKDQRLRAALLAREGAQGFVEDPTYGPRLLTMWNRMLRDFERRSNSPSARNLVQQSRSWQIRNQPRIPETGQAPSEGELLYRQAQDKAAEAERFESDKQIERAAQAYREAATLYGRAAEKGGPYKERAMARKARSKQREGKLYLRAGQDAKGLRLLEEAKRALDAYLQFARDPANELTASDEKAARNDAVAQSRYFIAEANDYLAKATDDAAKKKQLAEETAEILQGFAGDHTDARQRSLVMVSLAYRIRALLDLGRNEEAATVFRKMQSLDPENRLTVSSGALVASALRKPLSERYDALVGKVDPDDPEWEAIAAKPGFQDLREKLSRVNALYRDWLKSSKSASSNMKNWFAVGSYFWELADWEAAAEILREGVARFDNAENIDQKRMRFMKYRLLVAVFNLAKKKEMKGDSEAASRLWREAGTLARERLDSEGRKINPRYLRRMAAEINGGFVVREPGRPMKWFPALGDFGEAINHWKVIRRYAEGKDQDTWWEATFYIYHCLFRKRKAEGQPYEAVKQAMEQTELALGGLGGDKYGRHFDWLKDQF